MNSKIEIALAADGKYFDPLFVTATSMAAYCRAPEVELRFNILDDGIATDDWVLLKRKVRELHPRCSFNRLPVDQKCFSSFPEWNSNRMAYARLLLPELLPDVKWVLYSDCDFLWLRDVAELWKECDDEKSVVAVRDDGSWDVSERLWFQKNGFPEKNGTYFCSGMCLFNLELFRLNSYSKKIFEIIRIYQPLNFPDQTALNVICAGTEKIVDQKWMRLTVQLTPESHTLPSVIHYAGEVPWRFVHQWQPLSDTMLLWHRFNARMRGVSEWNSLRRHFTTGQILWHRMIMWMARLRLSYLFLRIACVLTRHEGMLRFFKIRAVKYDLPEFSECVSAEDNHVHLKKV